MCKVGFFILHIPFCRKSVKRPLTRFPPTSPWEVRMSSMMAASLSYHRSLCSTRQQPLSSTRSRSSHWLLPRCLLHLCPKAAALPPLPALLGPPAGPAGCLRRSRHSWRRRRRTGTRRRRGRRRRRSTSTRSTRSTTSRPQRRRRSTRRSRTSLRTRRLPRRRPRSPSPQLLPASPPRRCRDSAREAPTRTVQKIARDNNFSTLIIWK